MHKKHGNHDQIRAIFFAIKPRNGPYIRAVHPASMALTGPVYCAFTPVAVAAKPKAAYAGPVHQPALAAVSCTYAQASRLSAPWTALQREVPAWVCLNLKDGPCCGLHMCISICRQPAAGCQRRAKATAAVRRLVLACPARSGPEQKRG